MWANCNMTRAMINAYMQLCLSRRLLPDIAVVAVGALKSDPLAAVTLNSALRVQHIRTTSQGLNYASDATRCKSSRWSNAGLSPTSLCGTLATCMSASQAMLKDHLRAGI